MSRGENVRAAARCGKLEDDGSVLQPAVRPLIMVPNIFGRMSRVGFRIQVTDCGAPRPPRPIHSRPPLKSLILVPRQFGFQRRPIRGQFYTRIFKFP